MDIDFLRKRLVTGEGSVMVACLLTLLALGENTIAPWAPFYVFYMTLTTILPFALKALGPGRGIRSFTGQTWLFIVFGPVLLQVVSGIWVELVYPSLLNVAGVDPAATRDSLHYLPVAFMAQFDAAGRLWEMRPDVIQAIYLIAIVLWAGFGEEVFFRGYMHRALRPGLGAASAAYVSSFFFALRHATQLLLVEPAYPWSAAFSWCVISFFVGLFMSYLYERTQSLAAPVIAHYVFNAIPLLALAAAPATS